MITISKAHNRSGLPLERKVIIADDNTLDIWHFDNNLYSTRGRKPTYTAGTVLTANGKYNGGVMIEAADSLRYDSILSQGAGTISMWFKMNVLNTSGTGWPMLLRVGNSIFEWAVWDTTMIMNNITVHPTFTINKWYYTAYVWDASITTKQTLYVFDDNAVNKYTSTSAPPSIAGLTNMWVGCGGTNNYQLNGTIDELRIDGIARSQDELTSWYLSKAPFYDPFGYIAQST